MRGIEDRMSSGTSACKAEALSLWLRDYASTRLNSVLMDERRCVPPHVVLDFGNQGLFGMATSESLGGLGLDLSHQMQVQAQLSAIDLTLGTWVGIHNALGVRPIERYAPEALKSELVPLLAAGRVLGSLAMTERGAGSNVRGIQTTATRDGAGWRVRGSKIWIGNGAWAGVMNVFARRPREEGGGVNAMCLRAGTPGLVIGPEALTLGMRAIVQNEVFLEDAFVPAEQLLGNAGDGLAVADDAFSVARLGIGASSLGGLRRCAQLAMRYASRRQIATGVSLENTTTREVMSWLVCAIAGLEEMLALTIAEAERTGVPPPFQSAVCKVLGSELLSRGADLVLQLLGGRGYIEPNVLPQIVRDSRVFRIFEGPSETIESHLGSAVLLGMLPVNALLGPGVLAPEAAKVTEAALEQCHSGWPEPGPETKQHLRSVVGRIALWSALAGAAEHADDRRSTPTSKSARHWARKQLEHHIHEGLGRMREPTMLAPSLLEETIASYALTIGDVDQEAAAADYVIDPMLAREAPRAVPTRSH